jgi:hypothetical protein
MMIQIRRDGLYHQENAVYARTEMSPQKHVRDAISQKIFGFEPFIVCDEKEATVWIPKNELAPQAPIDHDLSVHVFYKKPETNEEELIPFKAA